MAKVSRIKMKNGKHYLFNGLTRVTCSFQFFIHSSNLFVQSYRVLALHVSFPTLLYFYFIRFIRINLIIGTFSKPVHSSRFIPLVFPISFSFFLFPIHRFHFRLSFIFFFHQVQSHPLIVRFSSYHLSIYFLNFCYLFPRIMNSLVVCSIHHHHVPSHLLCRNFPISDRGQKSIIHRKRVPRTSKSNLRSRFIEKRHRQRPRLSSHANSLLLVIY